MYRKSVFAILAVLVIALACLSINGCKKQQPAVETASQPSKQPQAEMNVPLEPNMPAEPNMPIEPNMPELNTPMEPNMPAEEGAPATEY